MIRPFYTAAVKGYSQLIRVAALAGKTKARQWVSGRKKKIPSIGSEKVAWFHCASLGEFEQGRPVIEKFKGKFPDYRIVLTFFSPSGYEVRKNYPLADEILYLPADTPENAKDFIRKIHPDIAFFVKYEFWFNYLHELKSHQVPTYLISGIFRKKQHFFRWYGGWFRKQLTAFDRFFVQDKKSLQLIDSILPGKVMLSGDTRFDRVFDIAQKTKAFDDIKAFKGDKMLFLAGSTWAADEEVILPALLEQVEKGSIKIVIAPHEVEDQRIRGLMKKLPETAIRYSKTNSALADKNILVIDSIGILSHLYQYADLAYIGGGFGVGIHNTLEAATFGVPISFGPNHQKFNEAMGLIKAGAAYPVKDQQSFALFVNELVSYPDKAGQAGNEARNFVLKNKGATDIILKNILLP